MSRRRRNKKWISTVIIFVLLIVAGVVIWLVWDNYFKPKDSNNELTTAESSNVEEEKKDEKEEVVVEKEDSQTEEKKKVPQYDGDDPNKKYDITGVITYAGVNGDNLMLRVNIDQYLGSGWCKLYIVRNDVVLYQEDVKLIDSAATSTCEGFNVPVAGLGNGKAQININVISGDKKGKISGEVDL